MKYDMDFLIAALIFLMVILIQFMKQKRLVNRSGQFFQYFLIIALLDVLLDVISTVLMARQGGETLTVMTKLALTGLYFLQVLIPYNIFLYTKLLCSKTWRVQDHIKSIWTIPVVVMELLVLCNYEMGFFFYFEDGIYCRGDGYLGMYAYALLYILAVSVGTFVHYKELGKSNFEVVWEFLLIAGTSVAIQALFQGVLMISFGITLGTTVLFITINNPYKYTDNLTGVLDHQYFVDWIQNHVDRDREFHVITVDMYQLRNINMIFGNSAGNKVLLETANKLLELNHAKNVFRVSGKRFAAVTDSLSDYESTRNGIHRFLEDNFSGENASVRMGAVVCGVMHAQQLKGSDTLLGYIDYLTATPPQMEETVVIQGDEKTLRGYSYEKAIEQFLHTAVEKDLFEVYFQPVYSIKEKSYVTMEALSRLTHPKLGPVSPEVFITLAEKNGQIDQIGYLQFRKICRFVKEHEEIMKQIKNVKVNLSPAELMKSGHCHRLLDVIQEYGLSSRYFQFEITETVAAQYTEKLYFAADKFREAGIGLCLDDFGSGYANLNTVLKLPFTTIKLDRSLFNGVMENKKIALFYQNIVSSLKNMGYYVVAEGVETKEELQFATESGVDMIQGYYFSKPVNEEKILEILEEDK